MPEDEETPTPEPMSKLEQHTRALRECDKQRRANLNDSDACAIAAAALRRLHPEPSKLVGIALDELREGAAEFYRCAEACSAAALALSKSEAGE